MRLACVMVGLPAHGKTYIAHKIKRYLTWLGFKTRVFNVGDYRRHLVPSPVSHSFFDQNNSEGVKNRRKAETMALSELIEWIQQDETAVGIYDATNGTSQCRRELRQRLEEHGIEVLFVESICEDESIVTSNIRDMKLASPDYKSWEAAEATEDIRLRIKHYEEVYEPINDPDDTYIKLINVGGQYIINMIRGYLESRIVYYLMNLHTRPKRIWFSRHGESQFNVEDKIGGDADLSPRGMQYALKLPELIAQNIGDRPLTVWTSSMTRTIQTASYLQYPKKQWKALDELNTGVCDGMTYDEIAAKYPEDFERRDEDKFNYRYRGGESYRDLVLRLEPIIMELERQENILIIAHQATIRCMYAYFMNLSHDELPYARIPLHTVIELIPRAYECNEKQYKVDIEAVDTYRPKAAGVNRLTDRDPTKVGASGEVVDASKPIIPISPQPYAAKHPKHPT